MYKVILVDDEPNTCDVLKYFIADEAKDFEVSGLFTDGKKAWEYICQNEVDCVITDIKMPCMNGVELSKNIYQSKNNIQVIILSGYGEFEYAQQAIKYGVTDYLLKPIDYDKLLDALKSIKEKLDSTHNGQKPDKSRLREKSKERNSSNNASIEAAICYIDKHYSEPISRDSVACICYMNSSYFGNCFKIYTGKTFTDYLTDLRIQKSVELLREKYSIEEIAQKVGYSGSRHFGRTFKSITGYTPTEYRINILNQEPIE